MNKAEKKNKGRIRRHGRVRSQISGTAERPRLAVFKSNRYLHVQIIDDVAGNTLVSGSTRELESFAKNKNGKTNTTTIPDSKGKRLSKKEGAVWLGGEIANRAKKAHISKVVFDRGGFRYIGRITAFADAARAGGVEF